MRDASGGVTVRLIFGLTVIAVGVLFLLGNMGILNPREYLRFWPALLIIAGLIHILQPYRGSRFSMGIILVIVGSVLLLDRLDIIHFSIRDFWPLILIVIGIMMVLNNSVFHRKSSPDSNETETADSFLKESAILGGFNYKCNSQDFQGGDLTAIMGGVEIDLRDASIEKEAVVDVFAVMGGVEIQVPNDWMVHLKGSPILGGIEDKTHTEKDATKRLVIRGTVIMGGVTIKN